MSPVAVPSLRHSSPDELTLRRVKRGKGFSYHDGDGSRVVDDGNARPHPRHRDPARVDRRAHQRRPRLAPAGGGTRPARPAPVQVPPRLDRVPRSGEVRPPARVRQRRSPAVRKRSTPTSRGPGVSREKVLATVAELLQTTLIRVGNDEYARENGAYGLTTFKNRHARVSGAEITFVFDGQERRRSTRCTRTTGDWRRCCASARRSPGNGSSSTSTTTGRRRPVHSHDVNEYLREAADVDITAKDFRTWVATVATASALGRLDPPTSDREEQAAVRAVVIDRSPRISATRPRSHAPRTCTRPCSRASPPARWRRRGARRRPAEPGSASTSAGPTRLLSPRSRRRAPVAAVEGTRRAG